MPRPPKLTPEEIESSRELVPAWEVRGESLHREFTFGDFREAFAFMTTIAVLAEEMDHHPNWSNVYNRVTIDLSTHDAGGLTELDFDLARRIDMLKGND